MSVLASLLLASLAQSSMAPKHPPGFGTAYDLNEKATDEEISRTEQTRENSPRQIEEELVRHAGCLVEKRGAGVARAMSKPASDRSASLEVKSLFADAICVRSDFVVSYDKIIFRNALASAHYRQTFANQPLSGLEPERLRSAVAAGTIKSEDPQEALLANLAYCVLQFGPAQTHAFVVSGLRTPEEKIALAALKPSVGQCLPPDERMSVSRTLLRGILADALMQYRAAAPATASISESASQ